MKLKYYLRGAGAGIILATALFMLSSFYSDTYNNAVEETTESTEDEAEKIDEENSSDSNESVEDEVSGVETVVEDVEEVVSKVEEEVEAETELTESDTNSNDTEVTYIAFTVNGGDSSNTVSSNLYNKGLVDDADAFNDYLNTLGVDDMIQAGTFYVKMGSTYDDLAAILVTKQENRITSEPEATPDTPTAENNE